MSIIQPRRFKITCNLIRKDGSTQPYTRPSTLHIHSYNCLVSFSRTSEFQDNGKCRYWYSPRL